MTALQRKLARDLWHMKSQALAIAAVIGCGVATFIMSTSTAASLEETRRTYYERSRFADIFVHVKRAPNHIKSALASLPGVAGVETRIVAPVNLTIPNMKEPAQGRLVSLPETTGTAINQLQLRRGRMPEKGRGGEALVGESFASTHKLNPGDSFTAVLQGRLETITMTGVASSPEFIYAIRPGEILPDEKHYGILWMHRDEVEKAFDMEGACNDICLTLLKDTNPSPLIEAIDRLTEPYGGTGAYLRADQLSNRFVQDEMSQLKAMATLPPAIFLFVAALLLHIVLVRLVRLQREQVAALKAFGYSNKEVAFHYLGFAMAIAILGSIAGSMAGAWMGRGMTQMYVKFFRFPDFTYQIPFTSWAGGIGLALGAAASGVWTAVRQAASLPPAQGMRAEEPKSYQTLGRLEGFFSRFSNTTGKMILRNTFRQPVKFLFSAAALAMAAAVMVLGSFSADLVNFIMDFQFRQSQRQDLTVAWNEPLGRDALHSITSRPEVLQTQPFRAVAARINHNGKKELLSLTGLETVDGLHRLMNVTGRVQALPAEGLLVSQTLADLLGASPGDLVDLEVLEGKRPRQTIVIAAVMDDFTGTAAYLPLENLQRLMKEDWRCSGVFITADQREIDSLHKWLKECPAVAGVTIKKASVDNFRKTMSENLLRMRLYNLLFATIIAFGVVYNGARIALSERGRDLATLRVLGFTNQEISRILLGEIATLVIVGIPFGLLTGYGFAALAVTALQTRTQRFPLIIDSTTFGAAALTVLVAAFLSALVVRKRLDHLDLVSVLKSRE